MGVKLGLSFDTRTLAELLKNRVLREMFWAKREEGEGNGGGGGEEGLRSGFMICTAPQILFG